MEGNRHQRLHAAVVSESIFWRRLRSSNRLQANPTSISRVIQGLGNGLWVCLLIATFTACRSTKSPEELSTEAGDFVGKVIYNSAGSQSNEQLSQGYGVDCTACGGLGYYVQKDSDQPNARQSCPSCQGKGWRTP